MCMVEQEVGLPITVAELVIWWLGTWNLVAVIVSVVELRGCDRFSYLGCAVYIPTIYTIVQQLKCATTKSK